MACICTGTGGSSNSCSCEILRNMPWRVSEPTTAAVCLRHRLPPTKHLLTRAIENFYEKCAAYNLRYCPYRRFTGCRNSAGNTLKDFLVLLCFFMANFIVFLTIIARIATHMGGVALEAASWIKKTILKPTEEYVSLESLSDPDCVKKI